MKQRDSGRRFALFFMFYCYIGNISAIKKKSHSSELCDFRIYEFSDYSSSKSSSILMAESGIRVPGPNMAATPAL